MEISLRHFHVAMSVVDQYEVSLRLIDWLCSSDHFPIAQDPPELKGRHQSWIWTKVWPPHVIEAQLYIDLKCLIYLVSSNM